MNPILTIIAVFVGLYIFMLIMTRVRIARENKVLDEVMKQELELRREEMELRRAEIKARREELSF